MATFIALLRKDADTGFGVNFPDFPGCVTVGDTMDEAYRLAHEVLAFHVEGMAKDRLPIPEPSDLDSILADPENQDAIPFLVSIHLEKVKSIRISVTMEEPLVAAIDEATNNRSAFLAEGARLLLSRRQ